MSEPNVIRAAEAVEGPFYGDGGPVRADVRDGRPGLELGLQIELVDVATGQPLPDLKVDLWHADAKGYYSGYKTDPDQQPENVLTRPPVNDERFLRGSQLSDSDGRVRFKTLYPGWYASRAPHIHLKVFKGETCILTSQLYLPEAVSDQVYQGSGYKRTVEQDTRNATDTVIALTPEPIDGCWVELERTDSGYAGRSVLGVDLAAVSTPMDPPAEFQPPLGGVPHDKVVR